jgi:WD40 repeat protein
LRKFDLATGKKLRRMENPGTFAVALTRDGKQALTAGDTMRLWDLEKEKEVRRFSGHTGTVRTVVLSPDGKRIVDPENWTTG